MRHASGAVASAADGRRASGVPRAETVLADPRVAAARARLGDRVVKRVVHDVQERVWRGEIAAESAADSVIAALPPGASSLHPVINATGVVLHTNLGRAPLSRAAVDAIGAASGYVDVEFDLATGLRARRGSAVTCALLAAVPAAGGALVVNNGAAALVLAATALAGGREIVVSRGEMVEIGAGFRIPDLVTSTGARLREVGATNRTRLDDYRAALGPDTGFVLKVHPSNFVIRGFAGDVPVGQLSGLGVPVVADIGSGLLAPDPALPDEPDATSWLRDGAALVTASGDKLLGGPQAGIILGRADLVETLRRHPLARALRVDKLTLAALEATLTGPTGPTDEYLHADPAVLHARAESLAAVLAARGIAATVVESAGAVGGGGAPGLTLPGWAAALPESFAAPLRSGDPPVVGRVDHGRCLVDLRCVRAEDDARLATAIAAVAERLVPPDR